MEIIVRTFATVAVAEQYHYLNREAPKVGLVMNGSKNIVHAGGTESHP